MENAKQFSAEMIAPCGLDCSLCMMAQAKEKPCPGCNGPDENKFFYCSQLCGIMKCQKRKEHNYAFCDECPDYPCEDVMEKEKLVQNAAEVGEYLRACIPSDPRIKDIRGRGLMIGIEFDVDVSYFRKELLYEKHIFTGVAGKNMIRLLPPLCLSKEEAGVFVESFKEVLQ